MKTFALAALVGLALAGSAKAVPNVVLIVTDDQRIGSLGPARTPAIWKLIRRPGIAYTNAHVPTSVCCPSRASILTGLFAHSTGIYGNLAPHGGWPAFYQHGLEERTLAVALDEAGYRTGLVGKYLNGGPPFPEHTPAGWDAFAELPAGYYNYTFEGLTYGTEPAGYATDVLRDRAVRFVKETPSEQPLFLYFTPFAPHLGAIPAPRHAGSWVGRLPKYRARSLRERNMRDKPPWLRRLKLVRSTRTKRILRRSQEALMAVDEAVAAIHKALAESGRARNTLYAFVSDNGILYGEHRIYGHKALPYRMATRVPMLLRWDGHVRAGTTSRKLALNLDLAPTIATAARVSFDAEGVNLLGSHARKGFPLEGKAWRHRRTLRVPAFCGYRTKRYAFVHYATGFEELYDYQHDPQELSNRARWKSYEVRRGHLRELARLSCRPTPPGFAW
jgi:N-acetylglucosamine-6-sulfatase